jgi:diguanylate cyclase (GGDEF)-like protein
MLLTRASQLFCESYVLPTVIKDGFCAEVMLTTITFAGHPRPKVVSVRRKHDGNLIWVFLEAENRTRLFQELEDARLDLEDKREELNKLARIDSLTGVANRRELDEVLQRSFLEADRSGLPIALLMMDIDNFKSVNDLYGHDVGDRALRALANVLSIAGRKTDTVARLGGDEFVCVLPYTDADGAEELCNRIHLGLAETAGLPCSVTVSIGVSIRTKALPHDHTTALGLADKALYQAKEAGRNRTVIWRDLPGNAKAAT